jgi:Mrp family chromosome partitioning ATPase
MHDLIKELKDRYKSRIIIFDLPPLLATDDALSLIPYFDASLMVVEDGRNTKDELKASLKVLSKTHFLGTVLNKGNIKKSTYAYQQPLTTNKCI